MQLSNMPKNNKLDRKTSAPDCAPFTVRQLKAEIFQALAHPTRIFVVEVLRGRELPAGTIAERVGVDPSSLSQHLSLLRSRRVIASRREGNQIFYSVSDKVVFEILDAMRRHLQGHLEDAMTVLREVRA